MALLPLFHTHKFTQFDWLKLGLQRMTHQAYHEYKLIIFQAFFLSTAKVALRKMRGIKQMTVKKPKPKHDEPITIPNNYL